MCLYRKHPQPEMLVSVLLNRGLAEVVTFSAVGNTALAATAKNTIFMPPLPSGAGHNIINPLYVLPTQNLDSSRFHMIIELQISSTIIL